MRASNKNFLLLTLAGCFLYGVSSGLRSIYGLILPFLAVNADQAYSFLSFTIAVGQLVFGISQPLFGIAAIKTSNRSILTLGALLMGAGLLGIAILKSTLLIFIFFGFILPAGTGAVCYGIIMSTLGAAFDENASGIAGGYVSASSGLGCFAFPLIFSSLLPLIGFTGSVEFLAIFCLLIIPVVSLMTKNDSKQPAAKASQAPGQLKKNFAACVKNRPYLAVAFAFFTCGFFMAVIETHLFSHLLKFGVSSQTASSMFALYGVATLAGSIGAGYLGLLIKDSSLLGWIYGSRVLVIAAFILLPKSPALLWLWCALFGLLGASTVPPTAAFIRKIFGIEELATFFGLAFLAHQIGSFFSAWFGGLFIEYSLIWIAAAALSFLASLACFAVSKSSE